MYDKEFVLEFFKMVHKNINLIDIKRRAISINIIPGKCITLVGPRRAGKTYIMLYYYKTNLENGIYLDLEHSAFRDVTHKDIFEIISFFEEQFQCKVRNVYIDEIQAIDEWEILVRSLLDSGYNVMITGSSSKFLSKEVATQLRGRTLTYYVFPLSFLEYLQFKDIQVPQHISISDRLRIMKELEEFLTYGSFPEVVLKKGERERILKEYYYMIMYKDFIERFKLSNPSIARYLFEFCFQNYANEVSVNKIINYVRSKYNLRSKDKIYEYTEYLEDTSVVFFLEKASLKTHERLSWPKKVYVCDVGISCVLLFKSDTGKKMENAVFLELKREENTNPLQELYYYKTKEGYEVDFLIKEGNTIKELIQVCYANSYDEIPEREIRALLHAKEDLNLSKDVPLTIITWDYEDIREVEWWRKKGKIRFIPLWKWLLGIHKIKH